MVYEDLIRDFAHRTRKNLEFIETAMINGTSDVYEVTQLLNSMLGLLVFPRERYVEQIPQTPLDDLTAQGWPAIQMTHGASRCENLRQLTRYLRNGIAHCNIQFDSSGGEISGVRIWNVNRQNSKDWEAHLSIADLRTITFRFIDLLEHERVWS